MALTYSNPPLLGMKAPYFNLPSAAGGEVSTLDFNHHRGLLVVFMCNHCPYVIAVLDRLIDLGQKANALSIGMVGINSNDASRYPQDSFSAMKNLVLEKKFSFPYLYDESQSVARAYHAVCTPDPFLFNAQQELVYQGRIDDSWKDPLKVTSSDLLSAMNALKENQIFTPQIPSMGCSIKWKV